MAPLDLQASRAPLASLASLVQQAHQALDDVPPLHYASIVAHLYVRTYVNIPYIINNLYDKNSQLQIATKNN